MAFQSTAFNNPGQSLDLTQGTPIAALKVNEHQVVAVVPAQLLFNWVPDPERAEKAKYTQDDPVMQAYADLRKESQRAFEGAKKRNAKRYAQYIADGIDGARHFVLPEITVYSPKPLVVHEQGSGFAIAMVPHTGLMVCIDGETQRKALQMAGALELNVKIVIHHGRPLEWARQAFHDLNVLEVKPNTAVSVAMDTQDIGTRLTRQVEQTSDVVRHRLHLTRRSLRKTDPEVLTISSLRTGIATTLLGGEGLQRGSRPIGELPAVEEALPDIAQVSSAVVDAWCAVLEFLEDELEPKRRPESVASSPVILAGIGIMLHRTLPRPPRSTTGQLEIDDVITRLQGVDWSRGPHWDGIAGKWQERVRKDRNTGEVVERYNTLAIGSPKELGYWVAEALLDPDSDRGKRIRP